MPRAASTASSAARLRLWVIWRDRVTVIVVSMPVLMSFLFLAPSLYCTDRLRNKMRVMSMVSGQVMCLRSILFLSAARFAEGDTTLWFSYSEVFV